MSITEIEHRGHKYRIGRLPAMEQFHITRRLTPVLSHMRPLIQRAINKQELDQTEAISSILAGIGELKDEDANYIFAKTLGVIQREVGNSWAQVWPKGASQSSYDNEFDMVDLVTLAFHSMRINMAGFMDALPSNLGLKAGQASATGVSTQ